ncbi:alpha/beta fold hydrolase [Cryptosporangium arvum]|uniref:alpha/beta fold hydrolase n=1 Tax=Cryptosporangium arvum TaxID=80871 RepID=UPI0004ACE925|nr:alpha/beta hydrolase [Cryptosporangium arvum]
MEIERPDGRKLEYLVAGPDDGVPLVMHTGTPSAALLYQPMADAAARHGLRLVLYSRPGYANSTPQPGRTVADVVPEIVALLDHLGANRFVTAGWSGGGPHALACATLLPNWCAAAAVIAGPTPFGADGIDWLAGMGAENIEEFGAAAEGEAKLTPYLEAAAAELATVTADEVATALGDLVDAVDRNALTDDFATYNAASFRASVSTGISGWRDDDLAFVNDWGFDLATVKVPVAVWQGGHDRMVPFAHGQWLAEHVPGATAHLEPAEGHLSIVLTRFDAIVEELAAYLR